MNPVMIIIGIVVGVLILAGAILIPIFSKALKETSEGFWSLLKPLVIVGIIVLIIIAAGIIYYIYSSGGSTTNVPSVHFKQDNWLLNFWNNIKSD